MLKVYILAVLAVIICTKSTAQYVEKDKAATLDSAAILKDLVALLGNESEPISYFSADLSIGNRLFSLRNNRLNTKQASTRLTIFTPTLSYFHKTGFSVAAGTSLLNDTATSFGPTQYSLSAGYDLPANDHFNLSFSYTRYFVKDQYSPYSSPIFNDFFVSAAYKESWLQPAVSLGYATGGYKQVLRKDTTIGVNRRVLYDSATSSIKYFSVVASVSHSFNWQGLLSKEDELIFNPTLLVNMGTSTINTTRKTNAIYLLRLLNRRGKLPKVTTTSFQAESAGINFDFNYAIGKFNIRPQYYLDYYLPKSDFDKFSQFFTITLGYTF